MRRLRDKVVNFPGDNNKVSYTQHGFKKLRSCSTVKVYMNTGIITSQVMSYIIFFPNCLLQGIPYERLLKLHTADIEYSLMVKEWFILLHIEVC